MLRCVFAAVVVLMAMGCGPGEARLGGDEGTSQVTAGVSYEQFKAQFAYFDAQRQVFITDGDIVIADEKQLREFYFLNVKDGQLVVNRVGSADDMWDSARRQNLSFCVSNDFGARKATIIESMKAATQGWMDVANVHFVYVPSQDANCTAANNAVLFNVRPINAGGRYIAAAFFPSNGRASRELVVDSSIFAPDLSVTGVLRHELGHTLGFRHEHTRPEAGKCFENNAWRALTPYDSASVMHYPQCNGTNTWELPLTPRDIQGAQALYGAPDSNPPPPPPTTTVRNFTASLARNAFRAAGPFAAQAGSLFRATLTGVGDGDLYVRFGSAPTASTYNCRPYLSSSNEECRLTVPATATDVYVTVVGYTAATVALEVEYSPAP